MTAVRIFDPAMCCSTGVCGPSVDPKLVRFSADLDWLKSQGVAVERFNLSQEPAAFAGDAPARGFRRVRNEIQQRLSLTMLAAKIPMKLPKAGKA